MAGHFLVSSTAIPLTLIDVASLSKEEARNKLAELRWGPGGYQTCPCCGALEKHYSIRSRGQWRCKHCYSTFSVTTGTPFANRKICFKKLLAAIFLFVASHKGISALKLRRMIGVSYRTSFILLHKLREAITQTVDHSQLSGIVEIDGGHFCGKWRKPRKKRTARERGELTIPSKYSTSQHRSRVPNWARGLHPKRQIVIALREVSEEATTGTDPRTLKPRTKGAVRTIVAITKSENAADVETLVRKYVEPGSLIRTDELPAYGNLKYMGYRHEVVNHSKEFCTDDGINQNQAESFIARPRRAVIGEHHHIAPTYILNYMNEMAWREDVRRMDTREQFENIVARVFSAGISPAFFNYGYKDKTRQKERMTGRRSRQDL